LRKDEKHDYTLENIHLGLQRTKRKLNRLKMENTGESSKNQEKIK